MHSRRRAAALRKRWQRGVEPAQKEVATLLGEIDVTNDLILADTIIEGLDDLERLDAMIYRAEARRLSALREVSQWNSRVGACVQRKSNLFIDREASSA